MSEVLFASAKMKELRAEASLPAKFSRLLDELPIAAMLSGKSDTTNDLLAGKTVAIKMHLGGGLGYTTIPPLFVKTLVNKVREAGGLPFVTDGCYSTDGAKDRGYTTDILGAPIFPASGYRDTYFVNILADYYELTSVEVCGEIAAADLMIVYSHGKGHGHCGWGGAIKNIAMGCVTRNSRKAIHALFDTEIRWDSDLCIHCDLCKDNCPTGAVSFDDDGRMSIFGHHCRYCMHCVECCPKQAITIGQASAVKFQGGMAHTTKLCLNTFQPNSVLYINHITNVTPFCDCWGFSSPSIVPDVGIIAGTDIVSVEQASIDMVKTVDYIEGSLPPPLTVRDVPGHLLEKIHGKDPYLQCAEAANIGLGEQNYAIREIE